MVMQMARMADKCRVGQHSFSHACADAGESKRAYGGRGGEWWEWMGDAYRCCAADGRQNLTFSIRDRSP